MVSNNNNQSKMTVEMKPIVLDGRNYFLRIKKDKDGRICKANLCVPCGDLAMIIEGDH